MTVQFNVFLVLRTFLAETLWNDMGKRSGGHETCPGLRKRRVPGIAWSAQYSFEERRSTGRQHSLNKSAFQLSVASNHNGQSEEREIPSRAKQRELEEKITKARESAGDQVIIFFYQFSIWLVERVVQIFCTKHRARWSENNTITNYFQLLIKNLHLCVQHIWAFKRAGLIFLLFLLSLPWITFLFHCLTVARLLRV